METFPRAGFRRRIGSYVYDFLLSIAVYMFSGAIAFVIFALLFAQGTIDNQGFEHAIDLKNNSVLYEFLITGWGFFWVGFFFVFFWAKSGQTIGMRAWRLRVQNVDGSKISKKTGVKRLLFTLLGLGNLAVIFDRKNKLSLQDRFTNTEVVVLSLEANKARTGELK
ncbi:RDD family protein [Thalassotalea psychrophila]|uniref:RDD family protein n=1 Tax=Thalassotalea psychrophila TaxID=3065647 RepID=A0ABY9TS73_9GAMM|nr:RDD family protein [Colwelliaceae bacterium SQ149]